jgi:hypothetical protein
MQRQPLHAEREIMLDHQRVRPVVERIALHLGAECQRASPPGNANQPPSASNNT